MTHEIFPLSLYPNPEHTKDFRDFLVLNQLSATSSKLGFLKEYSLKRSMKTRTYILFRKSMAEDQLRTTTEKYNRRWNLEPKGRITEAGILYSFNRGVLLTTETSFSGGKNLLP